MKTDRGDRGWRGEERFLGKIAYRFMFLFFPEKPVIHMLYPKSQNVSETRSFSIFCNATGNPHPNITWIKVGSREKLFPHGKTLSISSSSVDDEGIYTCIAENVRHKAKANSTVIIHLRKSSFFFFHFIINSCK